MRINGLTVCVNYADLLAHSLKRWQAACDRLVVVTSPADVHTLLLCQESGAAAYATEAFYRQGATFNKAAAICEAIEFYAGPHQTSWMDDWQLFFDADVEPPDNWRDVVEAARPQRGNIYGARRNLESGERFPENEVAGFFQLFHASDPNVQRKPLLDVTWTHAGGYDSEFQARWPRSKRMFLPLELMHYGEPGMNWWGRGNYQATARMLMERARRGGIAPLERLQ